MAVGFFITRCLSHFAASDFQVDTLPVTISRTQPRDCVTFRVTDDAVVDPGEFFNVILVSLSGFATVRPSRESAVVTIDDNDNCELQPSTMEVFAKCCDPFRSGDGCVPAWFLQCERECWNC